MELVKSLEIRHYIKGNKYGLYWPLAASISISKIISAERLPLGIVSTVHQSPKVQSVLSMIGQLTTGEGREGRSNFGGHLVAKVNPPYLVKIKEFLEESFLKENSFSSLLIWVNKGLRTNIRFWYDIISWLVNNMMGIEKTAAYTAIEKNHANNSPPKLVIFSVVLMPLDPSGDKFAINTEKDNLNFKSTFE
ncbi:hypothetical protein BTVI_85021 [Pitangus sulphuratus]|nr:hypothetical protein BTVI_85021 [Pitangus sulphuratus]